MKDETFFNNRIRNRLPINQYIQFRIQQLLCTVNLLGSRPSTFTFETSIGFPTNDFGATGTLRPP